MTTAPRYVRVAQAVYEDEVAAAFDAVADEYEDHYSTRGDLADTQHILARALDLYEQVPVSWTGLRHPLVDVGCGTGIAVPELQLTPREYLGIDISARSIEIARDAWASAGYRFVRTTLDHVNPGAAGFVLGAFGPLQHVYDLPAFATAVRETLAPGGRFLLMGRARQLPTRVLGSDALTRPYTAAEVLPAFAGAGLWNLHVYAHRRFVPRWWPLRWQLRALEWEFTQEWIDPNLGEWLVIEGRRT